MSFAQPKFAEGQPVKFVNDHDKLAGVVLEMSYDSVVGWKYKISSKYYDPEINDMVEGHKICLESELKDMTPKKEKEQA